MDHGVSNGGEQLVFVNARFATGQCQDGPCETEMGMAQKVNDSTFNKVINTDSLMQNVNDTNFIYYAPCLSNNELELYYTRYARGSVSVSTAFEICVAVRNTTTSNFSVPLVLFSETFNDLIEAPTLTMDEQIMYYHRKGVGSHRVVMRYRENPTGIAASAEIEKIFSLYPNPTNGQLNIKIKSDYDNLKISIFTLLGESIITVNNQTEIDLGYISYGTYFLRLDIDGEVGIQKFTKIE